MGIALIWGVNNVAAMVALDTFPPFMAVTLRFVLVLGLLIWMLRAPPTGARWPFTAMLGLVGPLHFGIQYIGLHMAHDLAPMVVAMQLWAPASVVFAALVLKERVSALRQAGVACAFAGVAAMAFDPVVFAQGWALLLVVAAACFYGLGAVLVRRIGPMNLWTMQAWIALASAPVSAAGSLAFERDQLSIAVHASWIAWACVVFGAVMSSILANAMMFRLVQRYEVSRTTPYLLLTPAISFTLGALVLGDQITPRIIAGAAITMGGVALVAFAERRFKGLA